MSITDTKLIAKFFVLFTRTVPYHMKPWFPKHLTTNPYILAPKPIYALFYISGELHNWSGRKKLVTILSLATRNERKQM